jgi:hypothetical protein
MSIKHKHTNIYIYTYYVATLTFTVWYQNISYPIEMSCLMQCLSLAWRCGILLGC